MKNQDPFAPPEKIVFARRGFGKVFLGNQIFVLVPAGGHFLIFSARLEGIF